MAADLSRLRVEDVQPAAVRAHPDLAVLASAIEVTTRVAETVATGTDRLEPLRHR